MDMYQKRKMRQEKRNSESNQESFPKVSISWYPGHMAKTKRLIKEKLTLIDIVYELIDARIPLSSKIKDIDDLISDIPKILVMTKWDLCDQVESEKWVKYYEEKGYLVYKVDLNNPNSGKKLINITHDLMKEKQNLRAGKGLKEKEIRALVIGIPNVGKSALINRMALRSAATTGNIPGVTKNLSFIKTNSNILLLDSPGILWPKLDNQEIALNLASMSAIKSEILPLDDVAIHILNKLDKYYPKILKQRYNLEKLSDDYCEVYDKIGYKVGALIRGGEVDYDKVSLTVVNDLKNGYIKGITFDRR